MSPERSLSFDLVEILAGHMDVEDSEFANMKKAEIYDVAGLLTTDEGVVVTMEDGSQFQLTIIRSR